MISRVIIFLINVYQKSLSLDHGPLKVLYPHGFCKFYPSCSEYGKKAIIKYGPFKGILMTASRVLRCNPFTKARVDEVK